MNSVENAVSCDCSTPYAPVGTEYNLGNTLVLFTREPVTTNGLVVLLFHLCTVFHVLIVKMLHRPAFYLIEDNAIEYNLLDCEAIQSIHDSLGQCVSGSTLLTVVLQEVLLFVVELDDVSEPIGQVILVGYHKLRHLNISPLVELVIGVPVILTECDSDMLRISDFTVIHYTASYLLRSGGVAIPLM